MHVLLTHSSAYSVTFSSVATFGTVPIVTMYDSYYYQYIVATLEDQMLRYKQYYAAFTPSILRTLARYAT